jgi:oligopeptide/dipeptide ABC transporter ATP-binding protein
VINLLQGLQRRLGLSLIFISHDLGMVRHISDRVAVMYLGKIVELADVDSLFARPQHPYSEALLSAVPRADPDAKSARIILAGDVPSPANPPAGCKFHPRCRYAKPICGESEPELREIFPGHQAACHFSEELSLIGVEPEK